MFNRHRQIVVSALLFAVLPGAAMAAETAESTRTAPESCVQTFVPAASRITGHPGRATPVRQRSVTSSADCPRTTVRADVQPMVLASFTDAPGGLALVRGNTESALEQIQGRKRRKSPAVLLTNECVGLTVLRQWSEARVACDAAVDAANRERDPRNTRFDASSRLAASNVAVAYSNRAVLNWLTDDTIAAHNDLAKARKLAPSARYVARNLLVTESAPSLAAMSGGGAALWAVVR
jgi:hypothetical protein